MHIDMNKIEQMVQLFIKLNTDSQEKLMKKYYSKRGEGFMKKEDAQEFLKAIEY